jgi:hypothetical protein
MQAPIEATLAQHGGNELVFVQIRTCRFEIAAIKHGRYERGGHDFGVGHLRLGILVVVQGFKTVVTQAVDRYNTVVHEFLQR